MRIGIVQGRDFPPATRRRNVGPEQQPIAGVGIVNEAFARAYFQRRQPGRWRVYVRQNKDVETPRWRSSASSATPVYYNVREPMQPTVYVPLEARSDGTLLVRTAGDPVALASVLRREESRARSPIFACAGSSRSERVRQAADDPRAVARDVVDCSLPFVALLLAGIGLYGVLNYAVVRQRREIGIRMALGARASHVVTRVTLRMLVVVGVGSIVGLVAGVAFGRVVGALLFQVTPTDLASMITPLIALTIAATLAALPPAIRAVRIDPVKTLRTE